MRLHHLIHAILAGFVGSALLGCSRTPAEPTPAPAATPTSTAATASAASSSGTASDPALRWDDPPRWKRHPPSSAMRAAEYTVPRASGDSDDGECIVITFGAGKGGTVDENVDRWVKQVAPATSAPMRTTRTTHGMNVTRVEVAGTYAGMQMPGAPQPASHTGWRLVGSIVEAPSGSWFFKLTGPDATIKAASKELDAMIDSAHPR